MAGAPSNHISLDRKQEWPSSSVCTRPRLAAGGAIHGAVAWRCGYALLVRPPRPRCNPRAPCLYARPVQAEVDEEGKGSIYTSSAARTSCQRLDSIALVKNQRKKKGMQEYRQHLRPPPSPFTKERKTYTAPHPPRRQPPPPHCHNISEETRKRAKSN